MAQEYLYKRQRLSVDNNRLELSEQEVDYTLLILDDMWHLHEMVIDGSAKVKFTNSSISVDNLRGDRTGTLRIDSGQRAEVGHIFSII